MPESANDALRPLSIRLLSESDLAFAHRLSGAAGWNQTRRDWQRLLGHEPRGCFLALWQGDPVGTVTTTSYGRELAWIGMMLVRPEFRRRGIATALMGRAIDYLKESGVSCIKLDATPAGVPVYEKLGFRPEWEFQRWTGRRTDPEGRFQTAATVQRASQPPADQLQAVRNIDRQAFGADRGDWLMRLRSGSDMSAGPAGYGVRRPGEQADYLGPVVAADADDAAALIGELLGRVQGPVFWDVPGPNRRAVALAGSLGFQPTRKLTRMWTGERNVAGQVEWQFAIGGPETG